MLKGDLASTPLPQVLRQLADGAATGCLHITDAADETAQVYLRGGRVYAVVAPGSRPQLGARLVSSGALGPEALAEALEAQRTELQGWRLGELLVHLGYVDQPVVEDFVNEQVRASLSDLLPWRHASWKFRVNQKTREDVAPPVEVETLLAEIDSRLDTLSQIDEVVHGPEAVPLLSAGDTASSETEIDADAWSLLCKVDGVRSVSELARECGFTMYEAGQVVFTLVQAGLLEIEEPVAAAEPEVLDAAAFLSEAAAVQELAPGEVASRLASALGGLGVPTQREETARALELPADDEEVAGSISRVSEALAALLGPATASDDVFGAPVRRPPAPAPEPVDPKKLERERRAAARRDRDAEELAAAQAELEAAKAAAEAEFEAEHGEDHVAEVVDLHAKRQAAEAAEAETARLAVEAAEQARLDAEADEQARLEAEATEQARLEAETAEQARLEAEAAEHARLEAEATEQARLAEEARLEEERLAAEATEQARLEAEAAEQARLEAEAAEQARLEAEAAEQARLEAEAAEQARLEAEAAEQARLEAEAAEQARLEADAAEQARLEAEAAEQARLAEEARLEEERLAAETAEQARLEAEAAEQARLEADAAEQARLEAEAAEQARLEAEAAEQARLAEEARLAHEAADAESASQFAAITAELEDYPSETSPSEGYDYTPASAFAELSAVSASAAEATPAAAAPVADYDDEPMPMYAAPDTDTASLLRELSSLGLDDDPPPPPPSRPARPTPPRPVAAPKKKKGLFGR